MSTFSILHLEDEALDSELVQELLRSDGLNAEIDRVDTINEFRKALENSSYALVLADYSLPQVDPVEALHISNELRPNVPFIFVSGMIGEETAIEMLKQGANDYVLKQRIVRLPSAVRRALKEAEEQKRRQQAELARVVSETKFHETFARAPIGMIITSLDGRYIDVNQAYCDLVGYPEEELLHPDFKFNQLVYSEDLKSFFYEMNQILEGQKKSFFLEMRYVRQNKNVIWVRISATLIPGNNGDAHQIIELVENINDRKLAEQAIKRSEEQFRNLAEQLKEWNQKLESRVRERTRELEEQSKRLRLLASQLTDAEQQEKKRIAQLFHDDLQQILIAIKIQLNQFVKRKLNEEQKKGIEKTVSLLESAIQSSRSLTMRLNPPVDFAYGLVPAIEWLARWVQNEMQLLVEVKIQGNDRPLREYEGYFIFHATKELLLNIIKHGDTDRACIRVIFTETDGIRIEVEDKGKGFDTSKLETVPKEGFGLFTVFERLEMMGGTAYIQSQPGKGTRVAMDIPFQSLPYPKAKQWLFKHPERKASASKKIGVLIVDDHKVMRDGLSELINGHEDMEVLGEAEDGKKGVEAALELKPKIVLMDVSMPEMDGIEATKVIKRELPDTMVIGLSMHEKDEKEKLMREAGAIAYLTKSEAPEKIFELIRQVSA